MQQGRDYTKDYKVNGKDKRLVQLLDDCSAEGLLDWKKIDDYDDCKWCPFKAECDMVWEECDLCSYPKGKAKLKAVIRKKHQWGRTHGIGNLVRQTA